MSNPPSTTDSEDHYGVGGVALTARGLRTRRNILDAALAVFSERTYHDASIVKITEAAGVAQGTFYLYFESKEEIFHEVVRDLNNQARAAMSHGAAQGHTQAEQERGGFRGYFDFVAKNPAVYRIIRQAETVAPEILKEHYAKIALGYTSRLRAAMTAGEIADADPEIIAWILMGIGEIIGARWVLWGEQTEVPDDVFDQVMTFVIGGLGGTSQ